MRIIFRVWIKYSSQSKKITVIVIKWETSLTQVIVHVAVPSVILFLWKIMNKPCVQSLLYSNLHSKIYKTGQHDNKFGFDIFQINLIFVCADISGNHRTMVFKFRLLTKSYCFLYYSSCFGDEYFNLIKNSVISPNSINLV